MDAEILIGENAHIIQLKKEVEEYFAGKRRVFEVALDTPGSDFQRAVCKQLQEVSYGTTSTYEKLAEKIKNEKAERVDGRAFL